MLQEQKSSDVVWHEHAVTRSLREHQASICQIYRKHKSAVIWFTGLSGAGKSTIANAVEKRLYEQGCRTFVLDGDNVRHGLCNDLGFAVDDRRENIRRIGEVAKLFVEAGVITITAFISPLMKERRRIRQLLNDGDFIEVYCDCSIDVCEQRDVKGLYSKARTGLIKDFTGISSPYEAPNDPDLVLDTATESVDRCVERVVNHLLERAVLNEQENI